MDNGEIAVSKALALHLLCTLGLAAGFFAAGIAYNLSLVTDPAQTLSFLLVFETPIVVASYSFVRRDHDRPYWEAVSMALFGLPVGALLNALGAIVLGAPVGPKYWISTIYWSCLMSLFTFVPAVCVFGWSRMDWQRIIANSKPKQATDCLVSLPAQGAIVGAWLGAWPMPLDWEMPWQEWPICVTYGAIAGYIVGMILSTVFVHVMKNHPHVKDD
ncbi:phosphatidylinositol-glycan biosynthesis class F protein-like [Zingiber officinale]|uniref:Phosphatidylinositol-glycan biosynthesis class F protein n=1 Tax=Zingiber officinale TaxID=94328 RepID=A0A8J5L1Q7_ZINOF|nr:phosphatidylinositol-glycan biosynthesis class F protein-like isoform X2 [Zingiber officinale]XP_042394646.1 phosphatidylinositol-glycan biosynthesis class F protein-like [Zingiber officinale]KAG6507949.1 hypothetical protein ZIOFF_033304 [Zingiber officinale]